MALDFLTQLALNLQKDVLDFEKNLDNTKQSINNVENISKQKTLSVANQPTNVDYIAKEEAILKEYNALKKEETEIYNKVKTLTNDFTNINAHKEKNFNGTMKNKEKDENGNVIWLSKMGDSKDKNTGELKKLEEKFKKLQEKKLNFNKKYQTGNTSNLSMFSTETQILSVIFNSTYAMAGNCGVSLSYGLAGANDPRLHKNEKGTRLDSQVDDDLRSAAGYIKYLKDGDKGLQPMGTLKDYIKPGEKDKINNASVDWSKFQPGDAIVVTAKPPKREHGHAFIFLGTDKQGEPIFRSDGVQKSLMYSSNRDLKSLGEFVVFRNDKTIATSTLGLSEDEFLKLEARYNGTSNEIIEKLLANPKQTFEEAGMPINENVVNKINELKEKPEEIKKALGEVFEKKEIMNKVSNMSEAELEVKYQEFQENAPQAPKNIAKSAKRLEAWDKQQEENKSPIQKEIEKRYKQIQTDKQIPQLPSGEKSFSDIALSKVDENTEKLIGIAKDFKAISKKAVSKLSSEKLDEYKNKKQDSKVATAALVAKSFAEKDFASMFKSEAESATKSESERYSNPQIAIFKTELNNVGYLNPVKKNQGAMEQSALIRHRM